MWPTCEPHSPLRGADPHLLQPNGKRSAAPARMRAHRVRLYSEPCILELSYVSLNAVLPGPREFQLAFLNIIGRNLEFNQFGI